MATLKDVSFSVVLCLLALVLAFGAGEGLVRLKNQSMRNYDIEMWRYANTLKTPSDNPLLAHEHIPNASAVLQSVEIRTNRFGLRGGDVEVPRPPQERRILFLGSSITLGWGVKEEDTMTAQLEKTFRAAGQKVTVLNAGIGNYNAPRYVERFLTRLTALEPTDIVVHYFLRDAETLESGGGNWLLRHSELAVLVWTAWHQYLGSHGMESLVAHYRAVYDHNAPGYTAMQQSLAKLADYARKHHIRLYLAMVPDVHSVAQYPFGFVHDEMQTVARESGYRYIDLLPGFGALTPDQVWAMPGDPHPNALGHKIMADELYPFLQHADAVP